MRLRHVLTVLVLAGAAFPAVTACSTTTTIATHPAYIFDDEFRGPAGSAPDPALWSYDLGSTGYGSGQLETYTDSRANSYLDGHGHLIIAVTRQDGGYQSARLVSRVTFAEGDTIEARIRLDPQRGLWPAWWLLGPRWPADGEVDMLENYGGAIVQTTAHTPSGAPGMVAQLAADSRWHVWEVQWATAGFTFYRDGRWYLHVNPAQMRDWRYNPGSPMRMILNVAAGGIAGIPSTSAPPGTVMEAGWVRAWR
jgi:beta-glucanase (GH16 family)